MGGGMSILQTFSTLNMGLAAFGSQGFVGKMVGKDDKNKIDLHAKPKKVGQGESGDA